MNIKVLKYGGSSVENIDKIKAIAERLIARKENGESIVVVVSAMGKTTNNLISMAKDVSNSPDARDLDMLLSTGEQISISLLSMAIKNLGHESISLTGVQAGIETSKTHNKARINTIDKDVILGHLSNNKIVVIAGFQGVTPCGEITTLGRGGSDTTAVSIAAVLESDCEIYTDVDGVYTIDPRLHPSAKKIDFISYDEMLELASRGANVLETRSVEMASKYNVPILVALNTGDVPGTIIKEMKDNMENKVVTGMSLDEDCLMVSLNNVPYAGKNISNIFAKLAKEDIYIDMISQTAPFNSFVNISFTGKEDDKHKVKAVVESFIEEFPTIDYTLDSSVVKLSVVGIGMISQSGVAAALFEILSDNDIDFFQVTTSEISISYTINDYDKESAIKLFAEKFDL
ncbi:MAG: aspartate kinase [Acidaminobacteraceae bacterium]